MLVVDGVPLAVDHVGEVVVLRDQDAVVGEQDVDAAHHVADALDVREHVASRDDLRVTVLIHDPASELLGEELPVARAGDPARLPGRLDTDRLAVELAE
jgi:hypothetical protein